MLLSRSSGTLNGAGRGGEVGRMLVSGESLGPDIPMDLGIEGEGSNIYRQCSPLIGPQPPFYEAVIGGMLDTQIQPNILNSSNGCIIAASYPKDYYNGQDQGYGVINGREEIPQQNQNMQCNFENYGISTMNGEKNICHYGPEMNPSAGNIPTNLQELIGNFPRSSYLEQNIIHNTPPSTERVLSALPEHRQHVLDFYHNSDETKHLLAPSYRNSGFLTSEQDQSTNYHTLPEETPELLLNIYPRSIQSTQDQGHMPHLQVQYGRNPQYYQQPLPFPELSSTGSGLNFGSSTTLSTSVGGSYSMGFDGSALGARSSGASVHSSISPASSSTLSAVESMVSCRDSSDIDRISSLQARVNLLKQRLGFPENVTLEFVNAGYGIKNPLIYQNLANGHAHKNNKEAKTRSAPTSSDDSLPFECTICHKKFRRQLLLNEHMNSHSDVKKFLCTFCGKGFNSTTVLRTHTRTHTGVRPYKCNFCEKSYIRRCSLEFHMLKVHGVHQQFAYREHRPKLFICEDCGHTTSRKEIHSMHLRVKDH